MHWISTSLNRKFLLGTFSGMLLVSLVFLVLFLQMYRGQLERVRTDGAAQVNRLLQASLEQAMLLRNLGMLEAVVAELGAQEGVAGVTIINRNAETRFSTDASIKGSQLQLGCDDCNFDPARSPESFSFFLRTPSGANILRSVNPVRNKPQCGECHGPVELNPINGSLVVDLDAEPIEAYARETALTLVGAGILAVFATLLGGWWFIQQFVISPVNRLSEASGKLGIGDLGARVDIQGQDELYRLGSDFNRMAENLQRSHRERENNQAFLQRLVDAFPDGIRVIGRDYRIRLANRAYAEQLGLGMVNPVGAYCFVSSHDQSEPCVPTLQTCPLHELAAGKQAVKTVQHHLRGDGSSLAVEIYAAALQGPEGEELIVESIRDLEQVVQYSHEQKLADVGRLAAGVAHEIHNPLSSIRIALDSLLRRTRNGELELPGSVAEFFDLVDEEIRQCIEVTDRLLNLSMFAGNNIHVVNLNRAVEDTLALLRWEAEAKQVDMEWKGDPSEPSLVANESDVRMIVLNLLQNAFHAMPRGGLLRVRTQESGGEIRLEVEDQGIGMTAETMQHIFDPFFSRRADTVEGTGLGLSIVLALVKRYGGRMDVDSALGRGSVFRAIFVGERT